MRASILLLCIALVGFATVVATGGARAQGADTLTVSDLQLCTGIENRTPVGAATAFPDTVGTVWCYTVIEGAPEATTVTHVWYRGDEKMAEVSLNVGPKWWRTWSSKKIPVEWTGAWRIDVVSASGAVLKSATFEVGGAAR